MLAACSSSPAQSGGTSGSASASGAASSGSQAKTFKVAIVQQMDHASLDEIAAAVTARLGNVFEAVLTGPEAEAVASIKRTLLRQGALGAAMSGSGPTVYGIFPNRAAARVAYGALAERFSQTYLAEPVKKFR